MSSDGDSPLSLGGDDTDNDGESEIAHSFRSQSPHSQKRVKFLMQKVGSKQFGVGVLALRQ